MADEEEFLDFSIASALEGYVPRAFASMQLQCGMYCCVLLTLRAPVARLSIRFRNWLPAVLPRHLAPPFGWARRLAARLASCIQMLVAKGRTLWRSGQLGLGM